MITISDLVRRLAAAGAPVEAITIAIEAVEQAQEIINTRRARNAERMRTVRAQSTHSAHTRAAQPLPPLNGPPPPPAPPSPPLISPPNPILGGRDATRPAIDEKFNEFKRAYPKRDGSNPWQPAAKKFAAALRAGADADAIIAGARRYATECSARQLAGTPLVAQAVTWLNQQRWTDYAPINGHAAQRAPPTAEELAKRKQMIEEGDRILREQRHD